MTQLPNDPHDPHADPHAAFDKHARDEAPDTSVPRFPRLRLSVAVALFALTIAGGVAARFTNASPVLPPPADPGLLEYSGSGAGPVGIRGRLDRGAVLEGDEGEVKLELTLVGETRPLLETSRVATDLVVVLDRSGSMQGQPMDHAKAAIRDLVGRLGAGDRFALVTYASGAQLTAPLDAANADSRARWLAAVDAIPARGGTNMASGIDLAADLLRDAREPGRAARVILLSDGHANEGDHSPEGLRARAARAIAGEYVLSTVGVGLGFDEALMTTLADAGTGNFYYVHHTEDLASIFTGEFESARETVAKGLAVEILEAEGVRVADVAGYPLERHANGVVLRPGALFSGQERKLWVTFRVDGSRTRGLGANASLPLGHVSVAYRDASDVPHQVALSKTPTLAVASRPEEYFAAVDEELFQQQLAVDDVNRLKREVARKVARGDRDEAIREIEEFEERNAPYLRALSVAPKDSAAYLEAGRMRGLVADAFEADAAPEAKNSLGKSLASEAVDGRRQGAKRK